ncbi:MAG TPA: type III pantothenate kinase [Firmicutes bacterium]|nr:type III pantothenate kinase [Bacillota bacterium]
MLLAIDVGNSNIMLGVFKQHRIVANWYVPTHPESTPDELGIMVKNLLREGGLSEKDASAIAISCVVPPLLLSLDKMSRKYFSVEPLIVGPGVKTGINILMDNPREVGADRIVNAVAGYHLYGGPLIIVDFGTATTFCAISEQGDYLGGVIAPGVGISTQALFTRAAKLPRVELVKPRRVIGKDTISGMQAGFIYGFAGQVDGIVRRMSRELPAQPYVVATGGFAEYIFAESETIKQVNPLLTLEGLRLVYERNRGS